VSAERQYDLIIIGGGMVGATLARALSASRLRIALVEPSPQLAPSDHKFDLRVSAITRASQRIFEALGVWQGMLAQRVSPFREMHVWEELGKEMHFDSADLGEPCLGHIIENSVITASLYDGLEQQANLDCLFGRHCRQLEGRAGAWRLQLDDASELSAALLVGADGSRSWLRQQVGITVRGWDYDHAAVVTYVKTEKSHQETAWQRFVNQGPLAFLPLTEGYSSIVWSTQPDNARRLCELEKAAFAEELSVAFAARLGQVIEVGPRAMYPLRFLLADNYVQAGIALVGDAAHTMHPLAGQGVNLGLLDAAALAEVLHDASKARRDIASHQTLRRYERWRRSENLSMLVMVDQIQRLFGNDQPVLRWLRDTGMDILGQLPLVRDEIIEHAMGNRGDLPKLARGPG
jgi:2-polyprenylphenol 6-hydroxylase